MFGYDRIGYRPVNTLSVSPSSLVCLFLPKSHNLLPLNVWPAPNNSVLHKSAPARQIPYTQIPRGSSNRNETVAQVAAVEQADRPIKRAPGQQLLPDWVDGHVVAAASMGSRKTTAQVGGPAGDECLFSMPHAAGMACMAAVEDVHLHGSLLSHVALLAGVCLPVACIGLEGLT